MLGSPVGGVGLGRRRRRVGRHAANRDDGDVLSATRIVTLGACFGGENRDDRGVFLVARMVVIGNARVANSRVCCFAVTGYLECWLTCEISSTLMAAVMISYIPV